MWLSIGGHRMRASGLTHSARIPEKQLSMPTEYRSSTKCLYVI